MTSPAFQPSLFGDPSPQVSVILSATGFPIDRSSSIGREAKDPRLKSEPTPGICRHCLCTGDSCRTFSGDRCDWLDETHTCCNAEACRNKQARVVVKPLPAAASIVRKPSPKSRFRPARRTSMRVAVDRWLTR